MNLIAGIYNRDNVTLESKIKDGKRQKYILNCCFEVMKELGPGFVESIYKHALLIAMRQKGLCVEVEKSFEVIFRETV